MNRKVIVAILLVAAVPAFAQAQKPCVTKDDAQKVVASISGDKAKIQTYCEIQTIGEQMERAYEKRNLKLVDVLLQKIEALEETLGPEYVALMGGLQDIDPEKTSSARRLCRCSENSIGNVRGKSQKSEGASR
jgi:hypothetical protein